MSEESIARLSRYIFRAPDWKFIIASSLLLPLFLTPFFEYPPAAIILVGIPAVLSSFFTVPVVSPYGRITLNRSSLLSFLCVIFITIFVILSYFISLKAQRWNLLDGYILALGFIFGFRLVILLATVKNSLPKVAFPSSLQTLFGALFLPIITIEPSYYVNLLIFSSIFSTSAFLLIKYIDAPLKKSLGISGMDLMRAFIAYLSEDSTEIEEVFEKIGELVDIPVTVIAFKRKGVDAREEMKAVFIIPSLHPGPLGRIGSGDIPFLLASRLDGFIMVPHGIAHHDFDLVSKREAEKVVIAAKEALSSMNFYDYATPSSRFYENDVKIIGQFFGDSVMLIFTTSPIPSEDAEFAIGIAAMAEAKAAGARCAAIIDAHNCGAQGAKIITLGSKLSSDIIRCVGRATKELSKRDKGGLKVGVASQKAKFYDGTEVVEIEIKVAIIEVLGEKTAYVLIDGNNMVVGLREEVIRHLKGELGVDDAEVMTTDSHVTNKKDAYNYVGMKISHEEIIRVICQICKEAMSNIEPVEVGVETKIAKDVAVCGSYTVAKLI
ncbi:MAG: DUF2070 family protein, partial [Candidatus Methanospirareceae archaeon]